MVKKYEKQILTIYLNNSSSPFKERAINLSKLLDAYYFESDKKLRSRIKGVKMDTKRRIEKLLLTELVKVISHSETECSKNNRAIHALSHVQASMVFENLNPRLSRELVALSCDFSKGSEFEHFSILSRLSYERLSKKQSLNERMYENLWCQTMLQRKVEFLWIDFINSLQNARWEFNLEFETKVKFCKRQLNKNALKQALFVRVFIMEYFMLVISGDRAKFNRKKRELEHLISKQTAKEYQYFKSVIALLKLFAKHIINIKVTTNTLDNIDTFVLNEDERVLLGVVELQRSLKVGNFDFKEEKDFSKHTIYEKYLILLYRPKFISSDLLKNDLRGIHPLLALNINVMLYLRTFYDHDVLEQERLKKVIQTRLGRLKPDYHQYRVTLQSIMKALKSKESNLELTYIEEKQGFSAQMLNHLVMAVNKNTEFFYRKKNRENAM